MKTNQTAQPGTGYPLDTDQFAELNRVKGQSVRARICRTGHYFGITPKKLANNRLAWPAVQIEKA